VIKVIEKLKTELRLRGFSSRTVAAYVFHNQKFLEHVKKNAESIQEDDVKAYIGYLISDKKQRPSSVNLAICALRFMYEKVMEKNLFAKIQAPKSEKKIPTVLSKDEIKKMLETTKRFKHKLLIEMLYSSGLRVSEAMNLKVDDLDIEEKMGIVRGGKGMKDRHIILSEQLCEHLSGYLAQRNNDSEYVFSVKNRGMSVRQAQRIVNESAKGAGIKKRVFCHALRSSFATHLLEDGVDIRVIQELLGHANIATTELYTKVSREQLKNVRSPLDNM